MVPLPELTSQKELLSLIDQYNHDSSVDGLLVQLPVPDHIVEKKVSLAYLIEG